jgi:hypothetical protein
LVIPLSRPSAEESNIIKLLMMFAAETKAFGPID